MRCFAKAHAHTEALMSDLENMAACVVGGLAMGSWDSWSLSLPSMRSRKLACERGSFRGFECHVSALRKIAAAAWAGTRRHYRAFNYKPHIYIPLSHPPPTRVTITPTTPFALLVTDYASRLLNCTGDT